MPLAAQTDQPFANSVRGKLIIRSVSERQRPRSNGIAKVSALSSYPSLFTARRSEASTTPGRSRRWPPRCERSSRRLFSVFQNWTCGDGNRHGV